MILTRTRRSRRIPGPLVLTLLLSSAFAVNAITIDPQPGPVVINTQDNGAGSLRQALLKAREGDTIRFDIPTSDPGYRAGAWTINLTSGQLTVDKNVTISGPGPDQLVLKRGKFAPPFNIFPDHPAHAITIEGLAIQDATGPPTAFVLLTGGTTAVLFVSVALLCRHFLRRNERRIRFGLLWDGHRQPLCRKCGHPLRVLNDFSFQCPVCEVELGAQGDNGRTISPREALARIRLKQYWT